MIDDVFAPHSAKRGLIEESGQTTVYHIGDSADMAGCLITRGPYYVLAAASDPAFPGGVFSGSVNLDISYYAAATISFNSGTSRILDSGNQFSGIKTNDTIVIKGSLSNDGVYTVTTGAQNGYCVVSPAPVTELAGAYIGVYKRTSHLNSAVVDAATGLMWSRTISQGEKVGGSSTGSLCWLNSSTTYILHPPAGDLSIVAPSTLRITGGAGELSRYHVGDVLKFTGFATDANNLPGWVVSSVSVNGLDLDIVLRILGKTTPTAEAAAGSRSIGLITRSIFSYAAAANAVGLSGFTDWRIPTNAELILIQDFETPDAFPDPVAFPGLTGFVDIWSSVTSPMPTSMAASASCATGTSNSASKGGNYMAMLVRKV